MYVSPAMANKQQMPNVPSVVRRMHMYSPFEMDPLEIAEVNCRHTVSALATNRRGGESAGGGGEWAIPYVQLHVPGIYLKTKADEQLYGHYFRRPQQMAGKNGDFTAYRLSDDVHFWLQQSCHIITMVFASSFPHRISRTGRYYYDMFGLRCVRWCAGVHYNIRILYNCVARNIRLR